MSLIVCSSARGIDLKANEIAPPSQFWTTCKAAIETARNRHWDVVHVILGSLDRPTHTPPILEIPAVAAEPVLVFGTDSLVLRSILDRSRFSRVELIGAFPGQMTLRLLLLLTERSLRPRVHEALFRLGGTSQHAQSAVLAFLEQSGALSRLPSTRLVHDSSENWTGTNEEDRP